MEKLIIDPKIENLVEDMCNLGMRMQKIREEFPDCLVLIKKQFGLQRWDHENEEPDDLNNFKIMLYTTILKTKRLKEAKKIKKIKKELSKKNKK